MALAGDRLQAVQRVDAVPLAISVQQGVVTNADQVTRLNTGTVLQAVCVVCAGHGGARQTGHAQGAERRRRGACDSSM